MAFFFIIQWRNYRFLKILEIFWKLILRTIWAQNRPKIAILIQIDGSKHRKTKILNKKNTICSYDFVKKCCFESNTMSPRKNEKMRKFSMIFSKKISFENFSYFEQKVHQSMRFHQAHQNRYQMWWNVGCNLNTEILFIAVAVNHKNLAMNYHNLNQTVIFVQIAKEKFLKISIGFLEIFQKVSVIVHFEVEVS